MGVLLFPNGLPTKKVRETLTQDEVKLVREFSFWCERRGLALDLFCRKCLDDGLGKGGRVYGENPPDSLSFHVTCGHADRIYGDDATR